MSHTNMEAPTPTASPQPAIRQISRALWERFGEIRDHVFSPHEDPSDKERVVHLMAAAHRIQENILERIDDEGHDDGPVEIRICDAEIAIKALRTVAQLLAGDVDPH